MLGFHLKINKLYVCSSIVLFGGLPGGGSRCSSMYAYVQVKDAQVLGHPGGKSGWRGKGSGKFSKKRK